ncbi:hypothetical protein DL96DRAFT_1593214 [Flagelloscypha sp. PMI_526]|nr:hypothetical protein DL96DRAFT_1593214 [Flagelloscypha sp. PMI_526]
MPDTLPIDEVVPSRSRSWSFYVVFTFAVIPVLGSIVAAWVYTAQVVFQNRFFHLGSVERTLFLLGLCEVVFSVYNVYLIRKINASSKPLPPAEMTTLQKTFQRVLKTGLANLSVDEESLDNLDRPGSPEEDIVQLDKDDPRAIDFRNSLRTWFGKCSWSSVRLHSVQKWLYWAMFNETLPPLEDVPRIRRIFLDEAVEALEKRIGCQIPEGYSDAKPFLLTLDAVNIIPRPLWWYAWVGLTNICVRKWFEIFHNMQFQQHGGLEYLLRIPEDWDESGPVRPLVFLHGLGLGKLQYFTFLSGIFDSIQDRPIFVPLQPHISQHFFHPRFLNPMTRKETGIVLTEIFQRLGWIESLSEEEGVDAFEELQIHKSLIPTGVDILSHSNGSYTHAWLCKDYPGIINRSAWVDPTCFVLSEGDVCYNFLYRPCKSSIELIMSFFVATEMGVANLLQRNFQWSDNNLWFEEIPNARDYTRSLFVIGGKDDIVNAERVRRYLSSHGVKKGLRFDSEGRHGQALVGTNETYNHILQWLLQERLISSEEIKKSAL